MDEPGNSLITLGQYRLQSISALEEKLAQYPRDASFTLNVRALDARAAPAVATHILSFAGRRGIRVKQER